MAKRLTRNDIAERAGVSPSTVSRALAGRTDLLPEETITHICDIAAEMGYQKNILASRLASNKSYQIGFVVPLSRYRGVFQVSYYSTILDAMVADAFPRGYTVSIAPIEGEKDKMRHQLQSLITSQQVDGLVIAGLKQNSSLPGFLEERKIPTVLVGSCFIGNYVGSVNCDPTSAIRQVMTALTERRYKRLFFVSGDQNYYDGQLQHAAIQQAVSKSDIAALTIIKGNYSRRSGYAAAEGIIPQVQADDCVFLANDRMATGFYRYCYENKISIPDQIGVIGSDDDEAATVLYPDLTTIHQPRYEMGMAAIGLLLDQIEGKEVNRDVVLEKTLCERCSLRSVTSDQ